LTLENKAAELLEMVSTGVDKQWASQFIQKFIQTTSIQDEISLQL